MARSCHVDHIDQYLLALLLEEGYLGVTLNHTPPTGADADGMVHYLEMKSSGNVNPEQERIFLRPAVPSILPTCAKVPGSIVGHRLSHSLWEFLRPCDGVDDGTIKIVMKGGPAFRQRTIAISAK